MFCGLEQSFHYRESYHVVNVALSEINLLYEVVKIFGLKSAALIECNVRHFD